MPEEQKDNRAINDWLRQEAHRGEQRVEESPFAGVSTEQLRDDLLKLDGRTRAAKLLNEELNRRGGHLGGEMGGGEGKTPSEPEPDMNRLIRGAAGKYPGGSDLDDIRLRP